MNDHVHLYSNSAARFERLDPAQANVKIRKICVYSKPVQSRAFERPQQSITRM